MNWETILTSFATSIVSSGILLSAFAYIAKKIFDKSLDHHFDKAIELTRLQAQETVRREAAIFDKQIAIFTNVLSTIYRLRNQLRFLIAETSKADFEPKQFKPLLVELRQEAKTLDELLLAERAFFPPSVFLMVHEIKHAVDNAQGSFVVLKSVVRNDDVVGNIQVKRQLAATQLVEQFQKIDKLYNDLTCHIQDYLGIENPKGN